jgi:hypothetical protein
MTGAGAAGAGLVNPWIAVGGAGLGAITSPVVAKWGLSLQSKLLEKAATDRARALGTYGLMQSTNSPWSILKRSGEQ